MNRTCGIHLTLALIGLMAASFGASATSTGCNKIRFFKKSENGSMFIKSACAQKSSFKDSVFGSDRTAHNFEGCELMPSSRVRRSNLKLQRYVFSCSEKASSKTQNFFENLVIEESNGHSTVAYRYPTLIRKGGELIEIGMQEGFHPVIKENSSGIYQKESCGLGKETCTVTKTEYYVKIEGDEPALLRIDNLVDTSELAKMSTEELAKFSSQVRRTLARTIERAKDQALVRRNHELLSREKRILPAGDQSGLFGFNDTGRSLSLSGTNNIGGLAAGNYRVYSRYKCTPVGSDQCVKENYAVNLNRPILNPVLLPPTVDVSKLDLTKYKPYEFGGDEYYRHHGFNIYQKCKHSTGNCSGAYLNNGGKFEKVSDTLSRFTKGFTQDTSEATKDSSSSPVGSATKGSSSSKSSSTFAPSSVSKSSPKDRDSYAGPLNYVDNGVATFRKSEPNNLGEFVLKTIHEAERKKILPRGHGYTLRQKVGWTKIVSKGSRNGRTIYDIDFLGNNKRTHCSVAAHAAFLRYLTQLHNKGMINLEAHHLKVLNHWRIRHTFNAGGWGIAKVISVMGIGENFTDVRKAEPGDFMKMDRSNRTGHQTVFTGVKNGRVHYWSSNRGTRGFGVQSERLRGKSFVFSRINKPQNFTAGMERLARALNSDYDFLKVKRLKGYAMITKRRINFVRTPSPWPTMKSATLGPAVAQAKSKTWN